MKPWRTSWFIQLLLAFGGVGAIVVHEYHMAVTLITGSLVIDAVRLLFLSKPRDG